MKRGHVTIRCAASFTLIELLVVVAIIAILAAMLLPSLQQARETSKISVCMSHAKQVAFATLLLAEDHDGWINGTDSPTIAATNTTQYWTATVTNYISRRLVWWNNGLGLSYVGPKAGCVGMDPRDNWWQYAVNTTFTGPSSHSWSNPGRSLKEVRNPSRIFLVADCMLALPYQNWGGAPGLVFLDRTVTGYYDATQFPRHGGRGLNFVFVDGHAGFWKSTGYGAGGAQGKWYDVNRATQWTPYSTWNYGGWWAE
jgi:prepilin-type N-terminal cleavage/methylation domain-containing protein/prepilin-type processing-associated H-X9-DG protein